MRPGAPPAVVDSECILCDVRGAYYVGKLISYPFDPFVELKLLGTSETLWLEREAVLETSAMPPHVWAERREVAARQKRGEPASTMPADELASLLADRERKAERQQAKPAPPPRKRVHRLGVVCVLAQALNVSNAFVARAYRLHLVATGEGPDADQLLEACARLEVLQRRKEDMIQFLEVADSTIAASAVSILSLLGPLDEESLHAALMQAEYRVRREALTDALDKAVGRGLITRNGRLFVSTLPEKHVVVARPDSDPSGWTWITKARA